MPCQSPPSDEGHWNSILRKQVDQLTRMLCGACRLLDVASEELGHSLATTQELRDWWGDHKEWDRKRLRTEEMLRQKRRAK